LQEFRTRFRGCALAPLAVGVPDGGDVISGLREVGGVLVGEKQRLGHVTPFAGGVEKN
jgi:hypothetical protein